jgi:hypothetical protein
MANAALAIVEMQIAKNSKTDSETKTHIAKLIDTSFVSDKNNPLALKMVAEHQFKLGNLDIA